MRLEAFHEAEAEGGSQKERCAQGTGRESVRRIIYPVICLSGEPDRLSPLAGDEKGGVAPAFHDLGKSGSTGGVARSPARAGEERP